jgi:outer membrane protein assembly factor BamA
VLSLLAVSLLARREMSALDTIDSEQRIADSLPDQGEKEPENQKTRRWAILPQAGYDPAAGLVFGAKVTDRSLFGRNMTLDVDVTYSTNQHQSARVGLEVPRLWNDRLLAFTDGSWALDPQREFFGLGNNDIGPESISTYEIQDFGGTFTVGWRITPNLAFNLGVVGRDVAIRRGDALSSCQAADRSDVSPCPFTVDTEPNLVGIPGGYLVSFSSSLVFDTRDSMIRPTHGWRLILKVDHTNRSLGDFEFTRYSGDASYLNSFFDERLVVGLRFNGEYVDGPSIPFWELATLGGADTLRGFYPYRFLGEARVLGTFELRGKLVEFDFFDLWRVRIDGVAFIESGRVFLNEGDLQEEFSLDSDIVGRIFDDFQYSYGPGLRIALSEALVARIDAGFSDEETGLLYLTFGHTF